MFNSIKYFEEKCINRFEELENNFFKEPTKIAEYVYALTEELHKLGLEMIKDSLESIYNDICYPVTKEFREKLY